MRRERLVQQIRLGSLALVLGQNCMQSGSGFRDMLMKRKSIGERRGWAVGGYRLGGGDWWGAGKAGEMSKHKQLSRTAVLLQEL